MEGSAAAAINGAVGAVLLDTARPLSPLPPPSACVRVEVSCLLIGQNDGERFNLSGRPPKSGCGSRTARDNYWTLCTYRYLRT